MGFFEDVTNVDWQKKSEVLTQLSLVPLGLTIIPTTVLNHQTVTITDYVYKSSILQLQKNT